MVKKRRAAAVASSARPAEPTEEQKNLELCRLEIRAVLERHGLELKGIPGFTEDGRIVANIIFVKAAPKPQKVD